MTESSHQLDEQTRHMADMESFLVGLLGKPVPRNGRNDQFVVVGQQRNQLVVLVHTARPSVDEHQRVLGLFRLDVNEMNVNAFNLGDEMRKFVQFFQRLIEIELVEPIVDDLLQLFARKTVMETGVGQRFGVTCVGQALFQIFNLVGLEFDLEGTNFGVIGREFTV